jgi:hypothetical protein
MRLFSLAVCAYLAAAFACSEANAAYTGRDEDGQRTQERLARIGIEIARGDGYVVFSPDAELRGNAIQCTVAETALERSASREAGQSADSAIQLEWNEARQSLQQRHIEEMTARNSASASFNTDLMRRRSAGEITTEEMQRLRTEFLAENETVPTRHREEMAALNQDYAERTEDARARIAADSNAGTVGLNFLHSPVDDQSTIVPLDASGMSASFVSEISSLLSPFLASCEEPDRVDSAHYYAGYFPYSETDRPAVGFSFDFDGTSLTTIINDSPNYRAMVAALGRNANTDDNSWLTLAGFLTDNHNTARFAGDYREDFFSASKRLPGIVYKYDAFWEELGGVEVMRRVFDGDFEGFIENDDFAVLYNSIGEVYSAECSAYAGLIDVFETRGTVYAGQSFGPDGSRTVFQEEVTNTIRLDNRFSDNWMANRGTIVGNAFDYMASLFFMQSFIETHGCGSATVSQLVENFVRAGDDELSAQEAGLRFSGADSESDRPTRE